MSQPHADLYLVHLNSGDTIGAQFNPTEFNEKFEAVYKSVEIPGMTYEPSEWDHTKSPHFSCELGFNAECTVGIGLGGSLAVVLEREAVELWRKFLIACCYPQQGGSGVKGAAPSPLLVVWPGFMSIVVKQHSVEFSHKAFSAWDGPSIFTAKVEWEAAPTRNVFYDDWLTHGTVLNDSSGSLVV